VHLIRSGYRRARPSSSLSGHRLAEKAMVIAEVPPFLWVTVAVEEKKIQRVQSCVLGKSVPIWKISFMVYRKS
jgi:hypothetical protein